MRDRQIVGLVSDTHGLVRPEALEALKGSDVIIHAGDVGGPGLLDEFIALAPVFAVRGNVDEGSWAASLKDTEVVEVAGRHIYVLHNIDQLDLNPQASEFSAVVYGHSHKALIENRNGVLYINPGNAGQGRSNQPITVARLTIEEAEIHAEIIELDVH